MMHGNLPEYQLAEKMKSRFSGRGSAVSGMRASSTSELVRRAQMGGDPSVNCSELSFGSGSGNRRQTGTSRPMYYANSAGAGRTQSSAGAGTNNVRRENAENDRYRTQSRSTQTSSAKSQSAGRGQTGREVANDGGRERPRPERQSGATYADPAETKARAGRKNAETDRSKSAKNIKKSAKNAKNRKKSAQGKKSGIGNGAYSTYAAGVGEITEVRVEGRRMTPMFAVFLVIGTLMIMSIVFSFSEIYQTTSEISSLENTLSELEDLADELELKLEEKNDIRVIEQVATEELGMVNRDSVQRKYISLSDGERIDVIENENAGEDTATSGVLLSSFFASLGNLFDYFR